MKEISFIPFETCFGRQTSLVLSRLSYSRTGTLAVVAYEASEEVLEPYATLTVNLPDWAFLLDEGLVFVDTNNNPWAIRWLEDNGIARYMGVKAVSGFCDYPLMKFDLGKLGTPDELRKAGYME